ncbi:thermonuclease family protein [Cohnella kolymensis]|uniref:thermonuclease family protein n=1 Tax=Cohnella kolymensis TaxID=1590652 RepID=UPI0009E2AE11|nr:thermonuclease family protein [Cohnella kolymensis]
MGKYSKLQVFKAAIACVLLWQLLGCVNPEKAADSDADRDRIIRNYPELADKKMEKATVARIVDGDTLELGGGVKVRLIGVNTPEVHGKVQPYGKEASAFTKSALLGETILLFPDVSDTDRYGRQLRYVFVAGQDVMYNERLVREGYAQVMTIPPNVAYAELFLQRQKEARENNKGLWAEDASVDQAPAAPSGTPAVPSCSNPIKGNINSKGEKIYHVPGASAYKRTVPEQWFCSEQEAREAGFRKAMN